MPTTLLPVFIKYLYRSMLSAIDELCECAPSIGSCTVSRARVYSPEVNLEASLLRVLLQLDEIDTDKLLPCVSAT
ncbi:MAG: hypothetical protein AB8B84_03850 [Granulosicoccus sp.]